MVELHFIRHGQTKANAEGILTGTIDSELTQKGIDDAHEIANELNIEFDKYYCSPLVRTHQTLYAIKGNVDFIIDERVTEVYSGDWQGLYKKELPEEQFILYKNGLIDPPNGESLTDVEERAKSFLKFIFSTYINNEKILVVTHNAFMRTLKRLFFEKDKVVEPKNLEVFIVNEEMYKKLKNI